MIRTIKNPHWTNNARTVMSAEFHYSDGRVMTAVINSGDVNNPDWVEIMAKFTPEELEENTKRVIRKINQQREAERAREQAMADKKRQEELFAIKLQAFEVDAIKNTTNRALKSAIRRAKNSFEVQAFAAALIMEEYSKQQTSQTDPPTE